MSRGNRHSAVPPAVLLVSNYAPDAQESMLRFASALERALRALGCTVWVECPSIVAGRYAGGSPTLQKWLGYVDKFVLFPWKLRAAVRRIRRSAPELVVHVCDHSNAMYTAVLRGVPHVVTCNDMLAVRSARGEFPQNPTRWSGRVLQRLVLGGLRRARHVTCISEATRRDVVRLTGRPAAAVSVVPMGLNYDYRRVAGVERRVAALLGADVGGRGPESRGYLLHVGGNQWYKNRRGLIEIYAQLRKMRPGSRIPALVLVGKALTPDLKKSIDDHGLEQDVVTLTLISNEDLNALYSEAALLLFPSIAEGFGWPILEAMACGCPVVTTDRAPMTEVGGDAAEYIPPDDAIRAAAVVLNTLQEPAHRRAARVMRGLQRAARFSLERMARGYIADYRQVARAGLGGAPPSRRRRGPRKTNARGARTTRSS